MTQAIPTELGTENVGKLLRQYALPAIIAMTASSLYNMIDSIFIGQGVGPMAISGLAVTFPFMNISAAFGSLVGVGAATVISVKLGEKDYPTAQRVLGNVFMLNIGIGILFSIISLLFIDPILYFFGASEQTIPYARDFMQIILIGNVVTHLYLGLNSVFRASGHPRTSMYLTILTVVLNIILGYTFIFIFKWGIRGAATATVISQTVSLIIQIKLFTNKNELLHISKEIFKFDPKISSDMLSIGLSPFLMNIASCMIVILINNSLKFYSGDLAIGAYGIVNRFVFIFCMIVMGLNQGMQPIAGYNYGAKLFDRVKKVLWITALLATIVMFVSFVFGMFFPQQVARIFTKDAEQIALAVYGMRITVAVFPIVGPQMVIANFFQCIGKARQAIFLSLIRQVLVLIPCLLILPHFFGITGVWASMPISDFIAAFVSAFMIVAELKKYKLEFG